MVFKKYSKGWRDGSDVKSTCFPSEARFQATPGGSQAPRSPVTPAPGCLTPSGLCGHPHKHGTHTHTDTCINKSRINLLKKYFNMVCFTVPGIHSSLYTFIYLLLYLSISSRVKKEKAFTRNRKTYAILQNNLHHLFKITYITSLLFSYKFPTFVYYMCNRTNIHKVNWSNMVTNMARATAG